MKVTEVWRYPVKTMAGEKLQRVRLGPLGIEGDRIVHVEDARERVITSRSHPRFLGHQGTLGPDGQPLVDGRPWNSPEVAMVVDIVGPGAKLVRYDGEISLPPFTGACCTSRFWAWISQHSPKAIHTARY
jgi:hypothetical protein